MYGEISINHSPGEALELLEEATGMPNSPAALMQSTYPGKADLAATESVKYSAANASWVVFSAANLRTQLQLVVSSRHGNVKQACEDIWTAFRSTAKDLSPKLGKMEIIQPEATSPIATGEVGLRVLLRRLDFMLALWPGVLSAILVGGGYLLGKLPKASAAEVCFAAAPAVLVMAVGICILILEGRRGGVTWRG
jgi:hypothetical protein